MGRLAQSSDPLILEEAVSQAVEERRPQLAARLVGLMPSALGEAPALTKARRAAKMLLLTQGSALEQSFSELEAAWGTLRNQRMRRIKERMRKSLAGRTDRTKRLDKRRR